MISSYFEGTCVPNKDGGLMSYSTIIYHNGQEIHKCHYNYERPDKIASNNIAEYLGLIAVLKYLIVHDLSHEKTFIVSDSKLVVEQMNGRWEIKHGKYSFYAEKSKSLANYWGTPICFEYKPVKKTLMNIDELLADMNND